MTGLAAALRELHTLAAAREAARDGDLTAAAHLLNGLDSPAALDLLARVHAQRGATDAADRCWARVLAADPGNPDATAGRAALAGRAARAAHPGHRRTVRFAGAVAVAAVVLLLGRLLAPPDPGPVRAGGVAPDTTLSAAFPSTRTAPEPRRPPPCAPCQDRARPEHATAQSAPETPPEAAPTRPAPAPAAQNTAAPEPPDDQEPAPEPPAPPPAPDTVTLAARLAAPGSRPTATGDGVRLEFDRGVFSTRSTLSASGAAALDAVGQRLAGLAVTVTVIGQTVAVPGGPSEGGSPVALARAQVAAARLAERTGLPLTAFTLATGDQAHPPFPEAARNRTVVLLVTPR